MTPEQAATVMGILTPAFAFQPDTISQWADMLLDKQDFQAARKTALALVQGATDRYVPGMRTFTDTYDRWARRHEEENGALADYDRLAIARGGRSATNIPTLAEGIEIAWVDYQDECARLGKQPNRDLFDSFLGKGREERKLDPRNNRGYNARRPFG